MGTFPDEEELFGIRAQPDVAVYADADIGVTEEPLPPVSAPSPEPMRLTPQARKMLRDQAKQTTIVVLALMDGIASILLGEEARMSSFERELISDPLERMLQRLDLGSSQVISKWSDPILFTLGISAWISRVMREKRERERQSDETTAPKEREQSGPQRDERQTPSGIPTEVALTEQTKVPKMFFTEIGNEP